MVALPLNGPDRPDLGDPQPPDAEIEELCEILGRERELVIASPAKIIRRHPAFEEARLQAEQGGGRNA